MIHQKYTSQTQMLAELDQRPNNRLDGNISEAGVKCYMFEYISNQILTVGDTIELARLPKIGRILSFVSESDFENIKYQIGINVRSPMFITDSTDSNKLNISFTGHDVSKGRIYLTITEGTLKRGSYIRGIVTFC
jgi:hypothetical protein